MSQPSDQQNETDLIVRKLYKETTLFIRDKYLPHYNLYQKTNLQEKIKCFDENSTEPVKYYACIEKNDQKMLQNSKYLQSKFGFIDENDKNCQESCNKSYSKESPELSTCLQKCISNMKLECITVYDKFYQDALNGVAEFKKIK